MFPTESLDRDWPNPTIGRSACSGGGELSRPGGLAALPLLLVINTGKVCRHLRLFRSHGATWQPESWTHIRSRTVPVLLFPPDLPRAEHRRGGVLLELRFQVLLDSHPGRRRHPAGGFERFPAIAKAVAAIVKLLRPEIFSTSI
jgi:hypothetical protein